MTTHATANFTAQDSGIPGSPIAFHKVPNSSLRTVELLLRNDSLMLIRNNDPIRPFVADIMVAANDIMKCPSINNFPKITFIPDDLYLNP